uniref:HMG box domain-containing protein n=1 Tax=Panagrolaimus sp. ES5 TaxID=591445 RepID=A0AC34GXJ6_9BILA
MFQFQQVPNNGAYINAQPVNIQYRFDPQQQVLQQHQQPPHIQHQIIQQQPQQIQIQQQPPPPPQQQHTREGKCPVRGKTSPYGFFVKMCYEEHKKKYPGENVQVTEISKKCAEKWKTMNEEEKRRFNELAAKDADRYTAEIAAYGGEEAIKKKKRAKKDPLAPKRALSAFFFFSNERRPEVQAGHPEWKVGQVAQELGRMWKALTEEEKGVYEKKANMDKQRYAEEMVTYRAQPPPGSSAAQSQKAIKQEVHGTIVSTSQPQQHQIQQPQLQHQQPQMVVIQHQPQQQQGQQQQQQQQMQQMHVQMLSQPGEM